jgi:integrase
MASLHQHKKSPFWYCSYRKPDGAWALRSTKEKNRAKATEICTAWGKATRDAERGKLTEHAARKVINEIYALAHEETLASATTDEFFTSWLARKEVETATGTFRKYRDVKKQFLEFLGEVKNQDISRISTKHVAAFRDEKAGRLSAATTNIALKILRVAFAQAKREGYITENPAENVSIIKRQEEKFERRPFTIPELRVLLAAADEDWKGMILFGLYTGQRLKDLATLTWKNVDLERRELRLVTGKTGRRQRLPLAVPLIDYLSTRPGSDAPKCPLFPQIFAVVTKSGRSGSLSNQFYELLTSAGLAPERTHKKTGNGRSVKRTQNEISFHCLRHTATSLMKNAGISPAIVQEFIGHDSPEMSANYTHIEMDAMRKAADAMPDLMK